MENTGNFQRKGAAWVLFILLLVAFFFAFQLTQAPSPSPENIPAEEFSAERAKKYLDKIANAPHPVGSAEHNSVRNFLKETLEKLDYAVEEQFLYKSNSSKENFLSVAEVRNLIVRVPGQDSTQAILVSAHYDSEDNAPGANDNGTAVAAMLETLRAVKSFPKLKNDLIFLFSDAEEVGLLGAKAFMEKHPLAENVKVNLNFEARGAAGPSILFEVSEKNGWLIHEYAKTPEAFGSSLGYEIYKLLPNNTDYSVFKEKEVAGLNFAYIGKHTHYHTPLDNLENVNLGGLQHHGAHMLGMVKQLAQADLTLAASKENHVFFNVPVLGLFHYPTKLATPLAGGLLLVFVIIMAVGAGRKIIKTSEVFMHLFTFPILAAVTVAACYGLHLGIKLSHPAYAWFLQGDTYNSLIYLMGFSAMVLGLYAFLYNMIAGATNYLAFSAAALLIWGTVGIATAVYFPGASYLFAFPMAGAIFIWAYLALRSASVSFNVLDSFFVAIGAAPALLVIIPTFVLVHTAMGFQWIWATSGLLVLGVGLMNVPLRVFYGGFRWAHTFFLLFLATLFTMWGSLTSMFDETQKRPDSLLYAYDADQYEAYWGSFDPRPDKFTQQFLGENPEVSTAGLFTYGKNRKMLVREDSVTKLPVPTILFDKYKLNGATFQMAQISSPRKAERLRVYLPKGNSIAKLSIGKDIVYERKAETAELRVLDIFGVDEKGITLTFQLNEGDDLERISIIETKFGLQEVLSGLSVNPRSDAQMPKPFVPNELVMLKKTYFTDKSKNKTSDDDFGLGDDLGSGFDIGDDDFFNIGEEESGADSTSTDGESIISSDEADEFF